LPHFIAIPAAGGCSRGVSALEALLAPHALALLVMAPLLMAISV